MDLKKTTAHLTILLALLFASIASYANMQENPLVKAILLYDAKNYSEAEQLLKQLLDENPEHLMVNYYYGACRTENNFFGLNEINHLRKGSTGEAPLKTDYYLGVQYHAQSQWEDALKHYNSYQGKTGEKEQIEIMLSEKIQQCYQKINPFVTASDTSNNFTTDIMPAAIPRQTEIEEYIPTLTIDTSVAINETDSLELEIHDSTTIEIIAVPVIPTKAIVKSEPINFVINGEITYLDTSHFRTTEGLMNYSEGQQKKDELEEQLKEVEELRKKYGLAKSYEEKQTMGEKILTAETDNYKLQSETKQLLTQAKQAEIEYWQNVPFDEKEAFIKKLETDLKSISEMEVAEPIVNDTSLLVNPNVLLVSQGDTPQLDEETKDELIYKIQLGAYSRGLPSYVEKNFKKLSYLRKIEDYTDEKGIVVYTTGNLSNYEDALKMQNQVRKEGIEDAYVVPYFNGKRITLKEAKEIEEGK